jgi:hypothetical protein
MAHDFKTANEETVEFKTLGDEGLHGDVILTKVEHGDEFLSFPIVGDSALAYGEVTGHSHKIFGEPQDYELREDPKTKTRHLRVVNPVSLRHQEHNPVKLPPGDYRIGIQRNMIPSLN